MALDLKLDDFKKAVGRGTRPNRYEVTMKIPSGGNDGGYEMTAEVSALALPDATVGVIGVPFRGRVLKLPGDRRYSSWGFTVYDTTEKGNLWKALHDWSEVLNSHEENKSPFEYGESDSTATWTIKHYDLNGDDVIKQIQLINCWPSSVSSFDLAYGSMDSLSQFSCQVEYEYYKVL